jgi:hypothetical protein
LRTLRDSVDGLVELAADAGGEEVLSDRVLAALLTAKTREAIPSGARLGAFAGDELREAEARVDEGVDCDEGGECLEPVRV